MLPKTLVMVHGRAMETMGGYLRTSSPLMVRGLGGSPTSPPLPHPRAAASPTPAPRMYSGGLSTAMAKLVHRANVACPSHEASTPASSRHRDCRWVARASPAPSTVPTLAHGCKTPFARVASFLRINLIFSPFLFNVRMCTYISRRRAQQCFPNANKLRKLD